MDELPVPPRHRRARPWTTAAVLAIAMAASYSLGSCGSAAPPARSPGDGPAATGQDLQAATARGLTWAVLSHLDRHAISNLSGYSAGGTVSSSVGFDDDRGTSVSVAATSPAAARTEPAAECGKDSGYSVVVCRVDAAGDLIEISRGPERSERGRIPRLIGRAYRQDGSQVLLEIHARGASSFPRELAEELLSDPLIGWQTSSSYNARGRELAGFEPMRVSVSVTQVGR